MTSWALARALHVLGVVFWIGGVAMVTTVLLPALRRTHSGAERIRLFEEIEGRFAAQSRVSTAVVGATGFYLVHALDLWSRFAEPAYWWMDAMVGLWAIFTVMLFVLEPFVLRRRIARRAEEAPEETFRWMLNLHRILLAASVITVLGAVAGAHGLLF